MSLRAWRAASHRAAALRSRSGSGALKLPRDLSGADLARALRTLGYEPTRQSGSHLRLTTPECGQHHLTIPLHRHISLGTLASILADIATHFGTTRAEIERRVFGPL